MSKYKKHSQDEDEKKIEQNMGQRSRCKLSNVCRGSTPESIALDNPKESNKMMFPLYVCPIAKEQTHRRSCCIELRGFHLVTSLGQSQEPLIPFVPQVFHGVSAEVFPGQRERLQTLAKSCVKKSQAKSRMAEDWEACILTAALNTFRVSNAELQTKPCHC